MKLLKNIIFTALFSLHSLCGFAWDEVTHAHMTQMIPELVKHPELKKLLQENLDDFIYGSWYTDIYQYTSDKENRVEALNPHRLKEHYSAFMPYLQKPDVQKQDDYKRLLALYLGSVAHLAEDLWYDNNLNPYQKQKSDRMKGDAKHGAFIAKQFGYVDVKIKRYLPYTELFKIYSGAGQLTEEIDTPEKLERLMDEWSTNQYKQLTALKLLNFVGGNQFYTASPWTAANLKDAPGGLLNAAEVAARLVENTWLKIKGKNVPVIIHAQYMWPIKSISFMLSGPDAGEELNKFTGYALAQNGDTIKGKFESEWGNEIVRVFKPETPFEENVNYTFIFQHLTTNNKLHFPFTADFDSGMDNRLAEKKPWNATLGMGLFGFIPLFAISLLFVGFGGILQFIWNIKHREKQMPTRYKITRHTLHFTGALVLALAIYVLLNKGWIIVDAVL